MVVADTDFQSQLSFEVMVEHHVLQVAEVQKLVIEERRHFLVGILNQLFQSQQRVQQAGLARPVRPVNNRYWRQFNFLIFDGPKVLDAYFHVDHPLQVRAPDYPDFLRISRATCIFPQ